MDCRTNSDLFFLTEEKFDFNVSLSPASSNGDEDEEDEVFIGPVPYKEKCVSVNETSQVEDSNSCMPMSWSPLIGDQLDAVCQEAHRLASQLQSSRQKSDEGETTDTTSDTTNHKEDFVQDAEAKLDLIGQAANALSPIKRETFCVQDSPMKQLPPAIQRRLVRGSSTNVASSNHSAAISKAPATRRSMATLTAASSTRSSARLNTSSPVVSAKVQPRTSLRGRASISVGVVLPSKPTAPTTSCSASKTKVDKTRLQPPGNVVAGRRRSPMSRSTSRAESYEDLHSDSTSVASDLSDCSLNSSMVGKRTLAPPTKNAVRNLSSVKAPPLQNRRVADRRNTSSSSSSVSSFNSSLSVSPAKGKLNSSLNRSLSGSTGPAPSSTGRPANHGRTRRSITHTVAEPGPSNPGRRSLSTQARKPSETERLKTSKSTPLKRAQATQLQGTPAKRVLEKTTSIPPTALVRPQSALKAKPKSEAQVVPTPSGGVKGVGQGNSVSNMLKPKRLMSANSMDSLPQKPTAVLLTPSAGGGRSLQMKPRRPSALPTPVRHRMSSIATPTSTYQTRSQRPPPTPDNDLAPGSVCKESSSSITPSLMQGEDEPFDVPVIQPFSLEEEQAPAAPPCGAPERNPSEETNSDAPSQAQPEPTENLIELETAEERNSKAQEVLLLDLPAPVLQPQEKLLIDLTNTPNLIRTSSKSCTATQLIDLSSPLIKWSPEDKREDNAPLIDISF